MATFVLDSGVNEREHTLIPDSAMHDCEGAEYRVGESGPYVARGRDHYGTLTGTTAQGLYEAGFDAGAYIVGHMDNAYSAAPVAAAGLSFSTVASFAAGTLPIVGAHHSNRHYVANGISNSRLELSGSSVIWYPIGLTRSTFSIGVSITQGAGSLSAATGLVYWATEYDSVRGMESMTGASVSTGAFSGKDGVVAFVTGVSSNPNDTHIRWYRSIDGGGFPDGGLIATTAIGTTSVTDTLADVSTLTVPQYGLVSIGGLDTERDAPPPPLSIVFGPYQDSLLGVSVADPRTLLFTPAGYPDSWPAGYAIPLETIRQDQILCGVVLPGRIGVFCNDSVNVIYRLPRDSDSVFAAGDAQDVLTDERGAVSRRGACTFTPPDSPPLAAWVSRDGIWASNLTTAPSPLTDGTNWEGRVDVSRLSSCRLVNDPINRRLVFIFRRVGDVEFHRGVWYLDYQQFQTKGMRITFADHGPLADAQTFAATDGSRRLLSLDSRRTNGKVYIESTQDLDDSLLQDDSGSVRFRMVTKEFMPGGPENDVTPGQVVWLHDAGPARMEHRFYFDRRPDNPEMKLFEHPTIRAGDGIMLQRSVNSFYLELLSVGTISYGVHWIDIENLDQGPTGGREGI